MKTSTMRNILFTAKDKSVIRTKLNLPGNMLNPPLLLLFCGKLYRYTGSGMTSNFYNEVPDTYMVIEDL
jgi:hypothetical protein